jgi:hypothetical protein
MNRGTLNYHSVDTIRQESLNLLKPLTELAIGVWTSLSCQVISRANVVLWGLQYNGSVGLIQDASNVPHSQSQKRRDFEGLAETVNQRVRVFSRTCLQSD